jgi:hypothetical protein
VSRFSITVVKLKLLDISVSTSGFMFDFTTSYISLSLVSAS